MSLHVPAPRDPVGESAPGPEEARLGPIWIWVLFLAGPLIWTLHFLVVYLLTEVVCNIEQVGLQSEVGGLPAVSTIVIGATLLSIAATLIFSFRGLQEWRHGKEAGAEISRFVGLGGLLLGILFTLAIASVGFPAAALSPC